MNTRFKYNFNNHGFAILKTASIALVVLVMMPFMALAVEQESDSYSQTLRVGVWIEGLEDGDILDKGEELAVGFQTNEDSYAVVYRINTEGLVTVLWPRSRMDDGFVFGGHEYMMPVTGAPRLVAGSRTGEGFIEAVVSRYPFDLRDLALDFHHEFETEKFDFVVIGDPFLAINEVNFAITGMEDSGDFAVTNYLSYYVHEEVDHPRYLCGQCHTDDDLAVSPYQDQCTINITVDHGWGNDWYYNTGYYPMYHNPVYVYYDPWTCRPWVNFWYEPYYVCSTRSGYHYRNPSYVWCDSPYYKYDGVRRKSGRGLYQHPNQVDSGRRKTSDYTRITGQVAQRGPSDGERETMRQKRRAPTAVAGGVRGGQQVRNPESPVVVRGERPISRTRPSIDPVASSGSRGGLQIRKPRAGSTSGQSVSRPGRTVRTTPVRNSNNGGGSLVRPGGVSPLRGSGGSSSGGSTTVRGSSRPTPNSSESVKPTRNSGDTARIKPVEPRKKGTRIWNSRPATPSTDRKVRNTGRASSNRKDSSSSNVRPRTGSTPKDGSTRSNSSKVKPKSSNRGSSGSTTTRSGSSAGSRSSSGSSTKEGSSNSNSKSSSSKAGREGGSSRSKR